MIKQASRPRIKIPRWHVYYTESPNIAFFKSKRKADKYALGCSLSEVRDGKETGFI